MTEEVTELQRQVVILKQAVDQSKLIHKNYDHALLLIKQKDKELKIATQNSNRCKPR